MARKKISVSEVNDIVINESLGYAIQHQINSSSIKDEDLADMWERAETLLNEIQEYLEENADSVEESYDDEPSEEREDY
jgi:hypothetical protein